MQSFMVLSVLCLLFFLAGCAKEVKQNNRPDWIDKPDGYFVGRCATYVQDPIAQEQCAYQKGMADLAMSKAVSADVGSKMDEKNTRVSGSIIDKWHDEVSDIMYVLIKEN